MLKKPGKSLMLIGGMLMTCAVTVPSLAVPVPVEYRAGSISFPAGSAGIYVNFSPAMPTTNYSVSVQPTNTGGYSTTSQCTYLNVLKKTTTQFQVQHKTCDTGTPIQLDTNITLNWIIVEHH
jgi:hypothetical protein